jgi:RNA polymerase sigma-70 factor (ECF subfamily)
METLKVISQKTQRDFLQIDLALAGNQQAYRALFKRYWKQVLFTVGKMIPDREEAQDVTMEAFSKVFSNLHRFRKEYGFNTWLYRVAINHSLDHLRRRRLPTTPLSTGFAEDSSAFYARGNDQDYQNPEEQIMQGQKMIVIEGYLRSLPAPLRDIAWMRFVEAYSYKEIAAMLDMSIGTVKARIHRARHRLQQSLQPWRNSA